MVLIDLSRKTVERLDKIRIYLAVNVPKDEKRVYNNFNSYDGLVQILIDLSELETKL